MRYGLSLYTAPTSEPLTIAEVKRHLRIDEAYGEQAPVAPTAALAGAGAGNVDNGAHRYLITFVTADGETEAGEASSAVTIADKTVNGRVNLTSIPLGGSAVTARKIYRTTAGGSTYLLLATISDNTTTVYTDNIADSSLGAAAPGTNTTVDPYLLALISAARRYAEISTKRAMVTQTWDMTIDSFPQSSAQFIEIPMPPLQSVTSISYVDSNGATQVWDSNLYTVDTKREAGRVMPEYSQVWPTTRGHINDVTIRFVAGYGNANDVPATIKHAMLLMIGHWYEHREEVSAGVTMDKLPLAAQHLLATYSVWRFS